MLKFKLIMIQKHQFLGLGKTKFNSSICFFTEGQTTDQAQLLLTERFNRQKASGVWPEIPLNKCFTQMNLQNISIGENRDVHKPSFIENIYERSFPFYEYLEKKNLTNFSSRFNPELKFIAHHEAHAYAALSMSPFEKSLIVVLDGAGTSAEDLELTSPKEAHEECSVYLQDQGLLLPLDKRWITFKKSSAHKGHTFGSGIGALYEKSSEFIFNSSTSSGKVMGLAPFGVPTKINDLIAFQENMQWSLAFSGKSKKDWQNSKEFTFYCNLAASVQEKFEENYLQLLTMLRQKYPDYNNLILTGGCALNCTNNAKILKQKLFDNIYVLPFPGDESISLGVAFSLYLKPHPKKWKITPFQKQSPYLGDPSSIPLDKIVEEKLRKNNIPFDYFEDVTEAASQDLADNKIIGWFQGRSEAGPRALGNRSILANPLRENLKNYLNDHIKFRENFRPYGCTVLQENIHDYFDIDKNFNNPFMSFAIQVRPEYRQALKEVVHIDGTSRMQTLHQEQNPRFYDLIKKFGKKTQLFCLLNTSFNVMDEPIVETIEDALRFFEKIPVDAIYIGNFRIKKQ